MRPAFAMQAQEIRVVGDQHAPFGEGGSEYIRVGYAPQTEVAGRRDIEAAPPQAMSDGVGDMLVKLESRPCHCARPRACGRSDSTPAPEAPRRAPVPPRCSP